MGDAQRIADAAGAEVVNPVDDGGATTVTKADSTTEVTKVQLGQLIDVIGSLRIVLTQKLSVYSNLQAVPVTHLLSDCKIQLNEIATIEKDYDVWLDVPNNRRYVIPSSDRKIKFSSTDEFITQILDDFEHERTRSETYLKEPPRKNIVSQERCYNPSLLGFPYDEAIRMGHFDDNYRAQLSNYCAPARENRNAPAFVMTHS